MTTPTLPQAAQMALDAPMPEPAAWKHDCAALCTNDVELWIDACPHCGKPRTAPPAAPEPEPVAWMRPRVGPDPIKWADGHIDFASAGRSPKERFITAGWTPLYASPAAPAPVVPCHIVNIGHRFDGKRQVHIPQLLLEFEPVPIGSPNDAKGWKNRDAMVNLIEASPPAPAVPAVLDEIELIEAVLAGYPPSMARSDALRSCRVLRGITGDSK